MKKIVFCMTFIGFLFLGGSVFAVEDCTNSCQPGETQLEWPICSCIPNGGSNQGGGGTPSGGDGGNNNGGCDPSKIYTLPGGGTGCCPGVLDENGQCRTELADLGINLNTTCLINGQCSMNVYKLLQIRKRNQNPTVMGLFQDITLASTTAFLGTVLTIALVISGLYFAIASISGKDTKKSKTIIIDCFVGLLLVMGSYTIIRLIQFLATAGG